jgi:hypothetical protein
LTGTTYRSVEILALGGSKISLLQVIAMLDEMIGDRNVFFAHTMAGASQKQSYSWSSPTVSTRGVVLVICRRRP